MIVNEAQHADAISYDFTSVSSGKSKMPKFNRNGKQSQYGIDEAELIEFVKRNPIMYEPNLEGDMMTFVENLWDEIAEKLNAPVNVVKKRWLNIKESYARRKSLRSAYNLDFLPVASLDLLNEDSCASSNCSSPKEDWKHTTRSVVSQVSTLSEIDRASTVSVSSSATQSKRTASKSRSRTNTPTRMDDGSLNETQSEESNICRFQDASSMTDVTRPQLSDSSFISAKGGHGNDAMTSSKWLSGTANGKSKANKHAAADSTRTFFESMAMTVSTFPQHIQAKLKMRICNLVGDAEYGLTIPKTL